MAEYRVSTAFVCCRGRYLMVRRSSSVRTMRGLWGGISGRIEDGEDPLCRAVTEVYEEAGIGDMVLLNSTEAVQIEGQGQKWLVHPFLFGADDDVVRLNWENDGYKWAGPDLSGLDTVPGLQRVLSGLL